MAYPLWELFINLTESTLFLVLLNQKLTKKEIQHINPKQIFLLVLQALLLFICNYYNISTLITVSTFLLLHYIFSALFYTESYIVKLFWVILYTIASITADALTVILPTAFLKIELADILTSGRLRIPFTLIYVSLLALFIISMLCLTTKAFYLTRIEKIIFIFLAALTIGIEQALLIEQLYLTTNKGNYHTHFLTVIFFLCIFLFVTLIIYVYNLGVTRKKNIQLVEDHALLQIEQNQYEQILSSVSELRTLKHDLHDHLDVLSNLIHNNDYTEASTYINEINNMLEQSHYALSTGNTAIDCIVTNKLNEAKKYEIPVDYTLHLPSELPLNDVEVCSLIGNLLNNAIEHCKNLVPSTKRYIQINMKPFNNMLSIAITNSSDGIYKTDATGHLLSRKECENNHGFLLPEHGIGLKRVKEIAEKHHGFVQVKPEENRFTVTILIPLKFRTDFNTPS